MTLAITPSQHADIGRLSKADEIAQLQREIDQDRVALRHKQQRLVELLKENATKITHFC